MVLSRRLGPVELEILRDDKIYQKMIDSIK